MASWSKRLFFVSLFLLVGYVLLVQVLRWIAFGEEERAALAVMAVPLTAPTGDSGFKYLAYTDLQVPEDALDATLATDVAAFAQWHAGYGKALAMGDSIVTPPELPSQARFPKRVAVDAPAIVCGLRDDDCLEKLRGNETQVRYWLAADAVRLGMVERALAADHLLNPYAYNVSAPLPSFQLLHLPMNDIALQALDGDVAGALPRACHLLEVSRRHLRNDGMLMDKMVFASLVESAAGLVLSIRDADPSVPLPDACAVAIAPVQMQDFQVCDALRSEFAMMSELSRQTHEGYSGWRLPSRWVLSSDKLQRGWIATGFAPMCTTEGQAHIARGEIPQIEASEYSPASLDFWAAPISHIVVAIAMPAYGTYQQRLLDHAAGLQKDLAAINQVGGGNEQARAD